MKPTILFLFNSSTYALQPWLSDGRFNVVTVDYDDTDHTCTHRTTGDTGHVNLYRLNVDLSHRDAFYKVTLAIVEELQLSRPSMVVSFAPCTDLAVSGAAHFAKKKAADPSFQVRAVAQAQLAALWGAPYIVENPVSVLATMWKKPQVYVHPYQFAGMYDKYSIPARHPEFPDMFPDRDAYPKKTGLWMGNGALVPTVTEGTAEVSDFPGHTKLGGKSGRTKHIRSLTPRGMAWAIYDANYRAILSHFFADNRLTGRV